MYPNVIKCLFEMLHQKVEPIVFQLHLRMIKNLLIQSMESTEKRGKLNLYNKKKDSDNEDMDSDEQAEAVAVQL
jgi:hypothetical protein